jgi:hypothetical protein
LDGDSDGSLGMPSIVISDDTVHGESPEAVKHEQFQSAIRNDRAGRNTFSKNDRSGDKADIRARQDQPNQALQGSELAYSRSSNELRSESHEDYEFDDRRHSDATEPEGIPMIPVSRELPSRNHTQYRRTLPFSQPRRSRKPISQQNNSRGLPLSGPNTIQCPHGPNSAFPPQSKIPSSPRAARIPPSNFRAAVTNFSPPGFKQVPGRGITDPHPPFTQRFRPFYIPREHRRHIHTFARPYDSYRPPAGPSRSPSEEMDPSLMQERSRNAIRRKRKVVRNGRRGVE